MARILLAIVCAAMFSVPRVVAAGTPDQPKILSGGLIGHRICGDFHGSQNTHTFDCDPLPTNAASGWQLTPLQKTTGNQGPNTAVILKITTPTFTTLDVELINFAGHSTAIGQIPSGPNQPVPKNVSPHGQVGVVASDDGTTKTWTLQFIVGTCTEEVQLNIFDVGDGTKSTNPLMVYLLRDPAETSNGPCSGVPSPPFVPGGGSFSSGHSGSNGSGPTHVTPQCGQFGVCTNCANGHPQSANQWSTSEACSLEGYKKTYGYENPDGTPTASGQVCTVKGAPTRASCTTH